MRFYDAGFFFDDGEDVRCEIDDNIDPTIVIYLKGVDNFTPRVSLFINYNDLVNFKNNVLWAYESYERSRNATKHS